MDKQNMVYTKNEVLLSNKKEMKYWHALQYGWTLKTWCYVKEASHNGPHLLRFHLYEMSKIGKSIEIVII